MAAIIEIPEEISVASAILSWVARLGSIGAPLADLIFGRGHSEPARNNAIGPLAKYLQAPAVVMHDMFAAVGALGQAAAREMAGLRARMDREYGIATRYAATLYRLATQRAHAELENLARSTNILIRQARGYSANLVAHERAIAHAEVLAAGRSATILFDQARGYAANLTRSVAQVAHAETLNLARSVNLEIASTKVYADTVSTQAAARSSAKLSSDTALAARPDYGGMRQDLEVAAAVFGAGAPGITALISKVPTAAPNTAPEAQAAESAITRVLTKTMADCVAPNCRNLSKYGKDLSGLGDLLGAAGLLGFLAYAITHPVQAAQDTENTAGAIVDGTVNEVRNLLGV